MGGTASRTDDPSGKDDVPLPEANDHPESPPPLHALDRKPSSSLNNFTTTEFIWNFGGHSVYVTGAWDDWRVKAALSRTTPTDFTAVLALPIGTFQYKFIVDGTWKYVGSICIPVPLHIPTLSIVHLVLTYVLYFAFCPYRRRIVKGITPLYQRNGIPAVILTTS